MRLFWRSLAKGHRFPFGGGGVRCYSRVCAPYVCVGFVVGNSNLGAVLALSCSPFLAAAHLSTGALARLTFKVMYHDSIEWRTIRGLVEGVGKVTSGRSALECVPPPSGVSS